MTNSPLLRSLSVVALAAALVAPRAATAQTSAPPRAPRVDAAPAREVVALREDLDRIVRSAGASVRSGVLVVSLDRGDTLYSRNPDVALSPASNMKLYSTGAALYYLGPAYRFATYLLADGPVRDGALEGDLVLYGTGDPTVSDRLLERGTAVYHAFADSLAALGVRRVRGDLVGDGSYYDDAWRGPGWQPNDFMQAYGAPVGALSFAENLVTLRVQPGSPGGPARLSTTPATRGLAVVNRVTTVTRGPTSVRFEQDDSVLLVTGQVRRGSSGATRTLPVADPANYAAAALRAALEERGIEVEGRVRSVRRREHSRFGRGVAPANGAAPPRIVALHLSPPLGEIAAVTNHVSHNLFAEALMKAAGRAVTGEGSFAGGARAVHRLLAAETDVDSAALRVVDGSGLSRTNRVTARATIHLLDYMTRSGSWEAYYESLPEAASPGGLRRMQRTAAAGNLRAKTGTIRNVSALSGYVRAADGERLVFSILINDIPSTARAKEIENQIGARIARFRRDE